jgi:peroxiredoxin
VKSFAVGAVLCCLAACEAPDDRPIAAFAALPGPGEPVPEFSFPALTSGADVSLASLRGKPAIVAFWDTHCPFARPVIDELKLLNSEYADRGTAVVVVSRDTPADLHIFEDSARSGLDFAVAGDREIRQTFDQSATATERTRYRVEWVPPLFLLMDGAGRVVARDGGAGFSARLRPALDSLLATGPEISGS